MGVVQGGPDAARVQRVRMWRIVDRRGTDEENERTLRSDRR